MTDTCNEVLAAVAELVDAFGAHDTERYFAAFAADATFCFYTHAERLTSRRDYEELWARWEHEDGFRVVACTSREPHVQVLGDTAVFTHMVATTVSTHHGLESLDERETIVFTRHEDGQWLAVHEHLSPKPSAG